MEGKGLDHWIPALVAVCWGVHIRRCQQNNALTLQPESALSLSPSASSIAQQARRFSWRWGYRPRVNVGPPTPSLFHLLSTPIRVHLCFVRYWLAIQPRSQQGPAACEIRTVVGEK